MDFTLSAERQQFAASLHDLLSAADGPAAARSWAAGNDEPGLQIWRALAGVGVTALAVPVPEGGLGADPVDLAIACEEIGHHGIPGPVPESLAAVPCLLAEVLPVAGDGQPQLRQWLADLASGALIATLAAPPVLPLAAGADVAGLVLLAERDAVLVGQPGPRRRSVHASRTLSEVSGGLPVAAGPAAVAAVGRALDLGVLACAAQLLGLGRALLEATTRHASQREQFGHPIGSFQAVQHHLADVLIGLEFARPLLFGAAVALAERSATTARDVSAAKVACADAARRAARTALQVHGAIGYTAEHDTGLWLTAVQALAPAWGSQAHHRARVLAALTETAPVVDEARCT